jgi:hypothetical protein
MKTQTKEYKRSWRQANIQHRLTYNKQFKADNPWYSSLEKARSRCNNPKNASYKYYGEKGIVCKLTLQEVKFLWFRDKAYLLKRPSIDRENSDGHYEVSNCRFIEFKENSRLGGLKTKRRKNNGKRKL